MADRFGALILPVPVPASGAAVSDPLLDYLLAYLQAVINARARDAWGEVSPALSGGRGLPVPVANVFSHDPGETSFNSNKLPALFAWRGDSTAEWMALDWQIEKTPISLLWVPPLAGQEAVRVRHPFRNAVNKIIDAALWKGQDPAWVLAGDPDPNATLLGSQFVKFAGLCADPCLKKFGHTTLRIQHADGTPSDSFAGLLGIVEVQEKLTRGFDEPGVFPQNELKLTEYLGTPGGDPAQNADELQIVAGDFKPTLLSITPSTGSHLGGTSVVMVCNELVLDGLAVTIGGAALKNIAPVDDCTFMATTTARAAGGPLDVVLTNGNGETSTLPAAFTFT